MKVRIDTEKFKQRVSDAGESLFGLSKKLNYGTSYLSQVLYCGKISLSVLYAIEHLTGLDFSDTVINNVKEESILKLEKAIRDESGSFHDRILRVEEIAKQIRMELKEAEKSEDHDEC